MRASRLGALGIFLLGLGACSSSEPTTDRIEPRLLEVDGTGLVLGTKQEDALAPEQLVTRVEALLRTNRVRSAELLVRRYPDVALLVLKTDGATRPVHHWIARVHDRQCSTATPRAGYAALLQDWAENSGRYADYARARAAVLHHIRQGRPSLALDECPLPVPSEPPGVELEIESARLMGVASLLADRPRDAAAAFGAAAAVAKLTRPYEHIHLLLLRSEAEHREGRPEAATATWREAVDLGTGVLEGPGRVFDPTFWVRALELEPANATWPDRARQGLVRAAGRSASGDAAVEAALWELIGSAKLERAEPRGALVAFGHAESRASDERTKDELRLGQARALVRLGENAAARSVLSALAAKPQGSVAHRALALLGALELKLGRPELGLAFLKKAVEEEPGSVDWTGWAEASANLGLAYLMTGAEPDGLRAIHAAQTRFSAERDLEGLVQCLRNELRYVERSGREHEAHALRARLEEVER